MKKSLSICLSHLDNYNNNKQLPVGTWNRLLWQLTGDELIFIPAGVEFNTKQYPGAGWLMEFNQLFVDGFQERYPDWNNNALLTIKVGAVDLPLTDALRQEMNDLAILLSHAQHKGQSELYLQAYADLILLNANHIYTKPETGSYLK
ncbi:hypothetical protein D3C87_1302570 [compost metagenome]